MTEENIKSKTIRLGDSGVTTIEVSDSDGDGFREEIEINAGDALVIEGPDGFMMTYHGPEPPEEDAGDE